MLTPNNKVVPTLKKLLAVGFNFKSSDNTFGQILLVVKAKAPNPATANPDSFAITLAPNCRDCKAPRFGSQVRAEPSKTNPSPAVVIKLLPVNSPKLNNNEG